MAGRSAAAEALYVQILQGVPDNGDALFYYGMLLAQTGHLDQAEDRLRAAAGLLPDRPDVQFNLAQILMARGNGEAAEAPLAAAAQAGHPEASAALGRWVADRGRFAEAERLLAFAAERRETDPTLWRDLGLVRRKLNLSGEAAEAFRRETALLPQEPAGWERLGRSLEAADDTVGARTAYERARECGAGGPDLDCAIGTMASAMGDHPAAEAAFRSALAADPIHRNSIQNLSVLLRIMKRLDESIDLLTEGLRHHPRSPGLLLSLGLSLTDRSRLEEAVGTLQLALAIDPEDQRIWVALAIALHLAGRIDEARAICIAGLVRYPDSVQLLNTLGLILRLMRDMDGAERALRAALDHAPDNPDLLSNLGLLLSTLGRQEEAMSTLRRALEVAPDNAGAHQNLIFSLDFVDGVTEAERQAVRRAWYDRLGRPVANRYRFDHVDRTPARRLRIGYVSADFCEHSAEKVFGPVLENHDHAAFHVTCYSGVRVPDATTKRLRDCADAWVEAAGLTDQELADRIHADGIDVLVDLSGHSSGNRLIVFAMAPAPVRVTAWGHATGTGIEGMDGFLADPVYVPAEERIHFAEQVVDLPCVLAVPVDPSLPPVSPREPGDGGIVFASLNRIGKLTDGPVAAWAAILHRVPGSRLLLKDMALDDESIRATTRNRFAAHGIAPERLDLRGRTDRRAHLLTLADVDVALDPFPAGGGVTTAETLLMGVPVVCLIGNGPTSRLGAALTAAAGLSDLAAPDVPTYVETAVRLAMDADRLRNIRAGLRDRIAASPLGDARLYTRAVEDAYRGLWRDWCRKST